MHGQPPAPEGSRPGLPPGFWTIWTTVAVDLVGFGIVLPILPLYAEDFGASSLTIGLLVASFSVAQLVMAPFMGRLSDRYGRKPVLLVSLFGTALGSLLTGLAGSVALLFVGRIVDGASGASVSVAQAAAADLAPPRERARLMGLLGAAFGLGFVAGPAIGALAALAGPRLPFFLAAALAFVNALVAIRRLPETHPRRLPATEAAELDGERVDELPCLDGAGLAEPAHLDHHPPPVDGPTLADRSAVLRLIGLAFVGLVGFSGFEATFALLGEERFGLELASTAAVFAGIGLALVAVQGGLVGPVTRRLGEASTLRAGFAANAVGFVLLSTDLGWPGLVVALALLVVGQGLITPTLSSAVAGRAGAQRGRWLGWQQSAGGVARVIGPVAAGALFGVGVGVPSLVAAALAVAALLLVPRPDVPGTHDAQLHVHGA
ncbi:MAG: MFS transporter [Acidimicrobiales bacterium]|nr:MFS transporter [Acidimicrobiales bacterium]